MLGVVQIATERRRAPSSTPIALQDLSPLFPLLRDPDVPVVLHGGRAGPGDHGAPHGGADARRGRHPGGGGLPRLRAPGRARACCSSACSRCASGRTRRTPTGRAGRSGPSSSSTPRATSRTCWRCTTGCTPISSERGRAAWVAEELRAARGRRRDTRPVPEEERFRAVKGWQRLDGRRAGGAARAGGLARAGRAAGEHPPELHRQRRRPGDARGAPGRARRGAARRCAGCRRARSTATARRILAAIREGRAARKERWPEAPSGTSASGAAAGARRRCCAPRCRPSPSGRSIAPEVIASSARASRRSSRAPRRDGAGVRRADEPPLLQRLAARAGRRHAPRDRAGRARDPLRSCAPRGRDRARTAATPGHASAGSGVTRTIDGLAGADAVGVAGGRTRARRSSTSGRRPAPSSRRARGRAGSRRCPRSAGRCSLPTQTRSGLPLRDALRLVAGRTGGEVDGVAVHHEPDRRRFAGLPSARLVAT